MLALLMSPLIVPLIYFFVVLGAVFLVWLGGTLIYFFPRHDAEDALLQTSVTRMLFAATLRVFCSSWCCPCRATRTIGDALAPALIVLAVKTQRASSRAKPPLADAAAAGIAVAAQVAQQRGPLAIAQDFFPLKIPPRTQTLRGLDTALCVVNFFAL
jgi:hypothetical protein